MRDICFLVLASCCALPVFADPLADALKASKDGPVYAYDMF